MEKTSVGKATTLAIDARDDKAIETVEAVKVGQAVLQLYASLPQNGKPSSREFTVLAGIVARVSVSPTRSELFVLSLATGTKSIGNEFDNTSGYMLHDSHAEVLARRGLKLYLLRSLLLANTHPELLSSPFFPFCSAKCEEEQGQSKVGVAVLKETTAAAPSSSVATAAVIEQQEGDKQAGRREVAVGCATSPSSPKSMGVRMRPGWSFHLYVSDSPCGDAAVYQLGPGESNFTGAKLASKRKLRQQCESRGGECGGKGEVPPEQPEQQKGVLREEQYGQQVPGVVRTKAGRGDLPIARRSLSLSCSDKLCFWVHVGLGGALVCALLQGNGPRLSSVVVAADALVQEQVPKSQQQPTSAPQQDKCPQWLALQRAILDRVNCTEQTGSRKQQGDQGWNRDGELEEEQNGVLEEEISTNRYTQSDVMSPIRGESDLVRGTRALAGSNTASGVTGKKREEEKEEKEEEEVEEVEEICASVKLMVVRGCAFDRGKSTLRAATANSLMDCKGTDSNNITPTSNSNSRSSMSSVASTEHHTGVWKGQQQSEHSDKKAKLQAAENSAPVSATVGSSAKDTGVSQALPCGTSLNWVRNSTDLPCNYSGIVCAEPEIGIDIEPATAAANSQASLNPHSNINSQNCSNSSNRNPKGAEKAFPHSTKKRKKTGVIETSHGTVEVTLAHTGSRQGATRITIGTAASSSRLCRAAMAALFCAAMRATVTTTTTTTTALPIIGLPTVEQTANGTAASASSCANHTDSAVMTHSNTHGNAPNHISRRVVTQSYGWWKAHASQRAKAYQRCKKRLCNSSPFRDYYYDCTQSSDAVSFDAAPLLARGHAYTSMLEVGKSASCTSTTIKSTHPDSSHSSLQSKNPVVEELSMGEALSNGSCPTLLLEPVLAATPMGPMGRSATGILLSLPLPDFHCSR